MALKSETAAPPDGLVVNNESGGDGDDLEDGEIFDDEDDTPMVPMPPPPPNISNSTITDELKKKASPPLRKPLPAKPQQRRQKRLREDERPFRSNKQRRRSDDSEKPKDKNLTEDEEMREMSPLRGDWERVHHRPNFGDDLLDDDDDEIDGVRRGMRGFANRRRGGRNGRGGRRGGGMNNRREGSQICRFFLQGKCQRGADCPYSHASQRKYELCKFYMMDCCAKKDRCPYLHSEFPCKYYHLGMKCYAGKKCKFSHGKITPQLRSFLLRDSKEHMESSPPKDDEARRERRERNRERHRDREHKNKERKKNRERKDSKDEDRYTLHFKVDPRTISDEEEGPQTPMPSPSQDNTSSDRETHSPELEPKRINDLSPKPEIQLPDPKDSGLGDELPDFIPPDLPKHQRELYKRIQQQQREATNLQDEDEMEEPERVEEKETEEFKDENWYSSEEEDGGKEGTVTAILNKLKQQPTRIPSPPIPQPLPPPLIPSGILPDIDISIVSKLLSSVRETIQQKQNSENLIKAAVAAVSSTSVVSIPAPSLPTPAPAVPNVNLNPLPPLTALLSETQPPAEKRRVRDPRLRGNSSEDDVDLRRQDVDLRQLPFKPAPIQPPASEIDASITAHPPITFHLIPLSPPLPPDYSHLQSKNVNDPRLKRFLPGGLATATPPTLVVPAGIGLTAPRLGPASQRDPRQARILPNDPRRKRADSDLRQQAFNHVDVDLRLQPPHLAFK